KWGMLTVLGVVFTKSTIDLVALFLLGHLACTRTSPLMSAARYISIGGCREHLESLIMACWVAGIFVKLCVLYYALALGTAQWLNLSDYRPIVLPLGLLLTGMAIWTAPNLQEVLKFYATSAPFYETIVQTGLPLLLLLAALIR